MGQLSASIAHEVNQPITGAITFADAALRWLRAQPPNLEEVDRALGLILKSNIRAGEVIHRLRDLAKKVPPRMDRLDINEVILDVIALSRREIEKSSVLIETELAEALPAIQGDRVQLTQVTLNLVINAIDAMSEAKEPGRLTISTQWSGTDALVTVRDTGPGLQTEAAEKLFKPFYTTKTSGMGMGLSISRSIIEAHRGRLWASANVPQGAVFQFTVPALRERLNSTGSES
jgi:C4-dicarboxylate-specific signal transduction histidine kinase